MSAIFRAVALLLLVPMAFACAASPRTANSADTVVDRMAPNIIVIFADDLGWGDVGVNGSRLIATPNIDRIGAEGVRLTNFYAGANVCTPSRAALLTGRHAVRSGMQHIVYPQTTEGLPQSEITLAELLRDAGYTTGMVGKWHLGHQDEHWPTEHGFDEFVGVAYSNDMTPFDLYRQKQVVQSPVDQGELTDNYANAAIDFIKRRGSEPFFLYYAETFPHIPLFTPESAAGRSEAGLYGDVVEHMDGAIGRILNALDDAGIADNTIVIFTSDNGPWFEGDAGDLRDRKGGTHEGSYRVPFMARWPAGLPAGAVSDEMSMNIDLLPTLANIAGAAVPDDRVIDGRDIFPVLRSGARSPHDYLYFFNGNDIAAIRDRRFRLVLSTYYKTFPVPFEQYGSPLLFDLSRDRRERFDYKRDFPADYERLLTQAKAMRADIAPFVKDAPNPFAPVPDGHPVGPQLQKDD